MMFPFLSSIIFLPAVVALALLVVRSSHRPVFKWAPIGVGMVQMCLLIMVFLGFDVHQNGYQFVEDYLWIHMPLPTGGGGVRVDYLVGVDGLSLPLVGLAVLILLIASISSMKEERHSKGYSILMLILNTSIVGVFCALDVFLFYVFFEFTLIPMYFLIGIWGGARREYASIKFFMYTLGGSLLILVSLIALYLSYEAYPGGEHTFNLSLLSDQKNAIAQSVLSTQNTDYLGMFTYREWGFLLLLIGFMIKLPAVPLHTWLPDAHVEASTPISVILAALLLKIGGYGLLRIAYPIFFDVAHRFSLFVGGIGVISLIYGGFNALASTDLKRLIAFSSVSHMGFVLLGIASGTMEGVSGACFQLISHGILSAMLFLLVGVLSDRTNDRVIAHYSGLASRLKIYTSFVLITFFATIGLPGFSGFIAEILVLMGAYKAFSNGLSYWMPLVATSSLCLSAGYFLWTLQRMFYGPYACPIKISMTDLNVRERVMLTPLAMATLLLGIWPQGLLHYLNPFALQWVEVFLKSSTP